MADEADPPVAEPEAPVDPVESAAPAQAEAPAEAEAPADAEAPAESAAPGESAAPVDSAAPAEAVAGEEGGNAEAHVDTEPVGPVLADPACVAWVKERVRCQGLTPEMWSAEHDDTLGECGTVLTPADPY